MEWKLASKNQKKKQYMNVQTNQPTFLFLILERTLDNKLSISISQGQIHTP